MKIDFSNKTVIVTGGTRGIGAAIVELFQQYNAQVITTGTNSKELARLNMESKREKTDYIHLDFTSNESVQEFLEHINNQDRIDVLINNAGVNKIDSICLSNLETLSGNFNIFKSIFLFIFFFN